MAIDVLVNNATTTVSSGGTDAPAAGTSESWTVASSAAFPAITTGVTQFRIQDPALPAEIMIVTAISGTTWTVSATWGTVTYFGLFDAPGGGNLLGFGALTASQTIDTGATSSFAAGALTITNN